MSTIRTTAVTITLLMLIVTLADVRATRIESFDVPRIIRNGTKSVTLSCIYEIGRHENGLTIRWSHDSETIYIWIPPVRSPIDGGIIKGYSEYPSYNLRRPSTHSLIRLQVVTVDMSGDYECLVRTFQEKDSRTARMIVYEPESEIEIYAVPFNGTHTSLTCIAIGAFPPPTLKLYLEGVEVSDKRAASWRTKGYKRDPKVTLEAIVENLSDPTVIECQVSIAETDYKRRERIVYYPNKFVQLIRT